MFCTQHEVESDLGPDECLVCTLRARVAELEAREEQAMRMAWTSGHRCMDRTYRTVKTRTRNIESIRQELDAFDAGS